MTHLELTAGAKLGRYELLRPIAEGGMASVWAARLMGNLGFQKLVAIKVMHRSLREEPDAVRMFLAEASLVARIRHQNVIEVLDLGEEAEHLYLVMEWIHGAALSTLLAAAGRKNEPMPLSVAVRVARNAAAGLHAAHTLAREDGTPLCLVHRDVSPHNILVGFNGVAKVVDFGIAKVTTEVHGHTQFGVLKGKVAYMAPEQLRTELLDARADIFALGIVLYQMATGTHPFRRPGDPREMVASILSPEPPTRPSELIPGFPARLEAVILRALEKSRDARYPTAEAFEADLARALPPSPREADIVRDYARGLLPDAYERGIELARVAMGAMMPTVKAQSFRDLIAAKPSASTLRAVAFPQESHAPESHTEITRTGPSRRRSSWALGATALAVTASIAAFVLSPKGHGGATSPVSGVASAPEVPSVQTLAPPAPAAPSVPSAVPPVPTPAMDTATPPTPKAPATARKPAPQTRPASAATKPAVAAPRPPTEAPVPQKAPASAELKDPYQ